MSVRRYDVIAHGVPAVLQEKPDGAFVRAEEYDRLRAELDALRKQEPVGIKSAILDIAPSRTTHIRKSGRRSFSGGEFAVYFECFKFEAGEWSYYYTDNDNEYPQWRSLNGGHYRKPDEIIKTLIPLAATPAPVAQKVPGVSARHAAKVWCSLKRSEKKRILKNLEVFVEQENGEDDLSWSMRALEALYSEPSRVSAMLAAAQSQEGKP